MRTCEPRELDAEMPLDLVLDIPQDMPRPIATLNTVVVGRAHENTPSGDAPRLPLVALLAALRQVDQAWPRRFVSARVR